MTKTVIIQKLIQVGQMLERGELEYSVAEIDIKHYLEQYVALRQTPVSGSLPDANPHTCPECSWLCDCTAQPCSCCSGNDL